MAKYIDLPNLKENLTNFLNKKINPIYAKKTEIPSNVSELNNDKSYQTAEEVGQAVTDGVARIVAGAPEDFDTLKEMSDWISSHETSAAAMNSAISDNSVAIANHTSNSDIHVTKEEKTKWNKLDSDLKDGTIIVAEATKATQDAQGNVIDSTYAKKTEVPQGTVVDDALSSTSINPVQNKVVKAELDKVNSNLDTLEYGEVAGGKNLFDRPIGMSNATFFNGTMICNTPTNTRGGFLAVALLENGTAENTIISAKYTSGHYYGSCPITTNTKKVRIVFSGDKVDANLYFDVSKFEEGTYYLSFDLEYSYTNCIAKNVQFEKGKTSTDYKPYIPSVKMLAEENAQQNDSLSVLGKCKNLLKSTLQTTTQNGVTCTNNGDGTYTLNGTNNSGNTIVFSMLKKDMVLTGDYRLIGLPIGASPTTFAFGGNGISFASADKNYTFNNTNVFLSLLIYNGYTCNNLVIKPMLTTNLNATYDDFVPYTGDGETLTHDVAELKNDLDTLEYSDVAGGKNLIDFSKVIKGYELDTGNLKVNANWYVTDYIKVKPNTTYTLSGTSSTYFNEFTIDKTVIGPNNASTFTTGSNTYYLRFNSIIDGYATPQLEEGTTVTSYEPYIPSVKMLVNDLTALNNSKLKGYTVEYNVPANNGGWHKIAQITGVYFNFDLYATGTWHNQRKSNAHFQIQNINGIVRIVQLSGLSDPNGIKGIRMVRVVDDRDTWILEEHSSSSSMGELFRFTIAGDVEVTPLYGSVDTTTDFKDSVSLDVSDIPTGAVITTSSVDNALSSTSVNPVQNKVVKAEFDQVNSDLSNLKDGTTPVAKAVADEDGNNIKNTYATKAKAFIDYSHKSVDLDTLTTAPSLISIGYDVTNKPSKFYGGYMFVVNAGYSASIALYQILFDVLYNKTYQRKYYHGSWTAWSYVTTPQDIETITLTTTSGTATLYKLGKMRHLVLNNATFSSTNVIASTDASVGTLYIRAEILISGSGGDELEGAAASFEDICISGSSMWNATRTATGTSPIAVQGATGSATWIVQ